MNDDDYANRDFKLYSETIDSIEFAYDGVDDCLETLCDALSAVAGHFEDTEPPHVVVGWHVNQLWHAYKSATIGFSDCEFDIGRANPSAVGILGFYGPSYQRVILDMVAFVLEEIRQGTDPSYTEGSDGPTDDWQTFDSSSITAENLSAVTDGILMRSAAAMRRGVGPLDFAALERLRSDLKLEFGRAHDAAELFFFNAHPDTLDMLANKSEDPATVFSSQTEKKRGRPEKWKLYVDEFLEKLESAPTLSYQDYIDELNEQKRRPRALTADKLKAAVNRRQKHNGQK